MPFDPKLISADDAGDEAGQLAADHLPEELALLGCALSDDAARLAERYPSMHGLSAPAAIAAARSRRATATTSTATRTAAAVALVAASIALAIYAGGIEFLRHGEFWQHGAPLADQGPARGNLHDAAGAAAVLQLVPAMRTDDLLPLRGAFFRELSGPQQEAVLDLLEENALAQSSVSI